MPIGPGTKLGSYVVQEFIGQGAMGVVYRAYHSQLERTGAVKVLQGLGGDVDSTARFRREAQAIAKMRHPNVLNVFDFGEFEGTPYMIVEYVEGGSLASRVKSGPLDRDAAIAFLRGIGDALDYAHKHGIVHRDVKPANVLLGPDDNPILADFGLAKLMESSSIKSLTGVTTGTPAYMAPEQVTGSQVGPAADRYSLAVMAYEMLTGQLPFDEGGVLEVLYAQVHRVPRPPSSVNPDLGPGVDPVISRGMDKNPQSRFERCKDFVVALESALKPGPKPAIEKTIAFAPPPPPPAPRAKAARAAIAATTVAAVDALAADALAVDAPAAGIRGPDPTLPAPVLSWTGAAKPGKPTRRSRRGLYIALALLVLLALLVGAAATYLTRPPTLTLSRYNVRPGDTLVVTASHLPSDQGGDIELLSTLRLFQFRADSFGRVTKEIFIPYDIEIGDHLVKICWGDACHAEQVLHVKSPLGLASSDPSTEPAVTPSAAATPTQAATSSPAPRPSPSPSVNPCPTSQSSAYFTTSGGSALAPPVRVSGVNFTPNKAFTVKFFFPKGSTTPETVTSGIVACNGTFTAAFTPKTLDVGMGRVVAADAAGRTYFLIINVS